MSADVAITLSGKHYRELVKAIEIVAAQRVPREQYVKTRLRELRNEHIEHGRLIRIEPVSDTDIEEFNALELERAQLASFFDAKHAFFS